MSDPAYVIIKEGDKYYAESRMVSMSFMGDGDGDEQVSWIQVPNTTTDNAEATRVALVKVIKHGSRKRIASLDENGDLIS